MFKKISQSILFFILVCTTLIAFAQSFFGTAPKKVEEKKSNRTLIAPSDFQNQVNQISQQQHDAFDKDLQEKLAEVPKPAGMTGTASSPAVSPSVVPKPTPPSTTTPSTTTQPSATTSTTMPEEGVTEETTPPPEMPAPPPPAAPYQTQTPTSTEQPYTGFQGGSKTTAPANQKGGWNIKY